jgi:L-ascorbate 6-phosphate lactonase
MTESPDIDIIRPTGLPRRIMAETVSPGEIAIWYTGGAGYVVRTPETTLIFDPFLGPSMPPEWIRGVPPPFSADEIADFGTIAAVVMSHEHIDHADPVALPMFAERTNALAIGPASAIAVARAAGFPDDRLRVLEHGATMTLGDVTLTGEPAYDPMAEGANTTIVQAGGATWAHCGDSLWFPGFAEFPKRWSIDAMSVTVGLNPPGETYYMSEGDAGRALRDAGARMLIHQHHDLWVRLKIDPARTATVASWYAPDASVEPAVYGERISIRRR